MGAVLICAVFFGMSRMYSPGGHVSPPQGDSLLFYQYARAYADGHALRFNKEDLPSTGSTSHLYPMFLAIPYTLGFKGDALATAGFALNAACYLALIFGVWLAARKMMPSAAGLAAGMVALSGQTAFTMFGQTDMGLFAVLAVGAFCAALYRRYILLAVLLIAATLTRPEGAVLSFLLVGSSFIPTTSGRRGSVGFTFAGAMGLFTFGLIAFFNHRLTGSAGFMSVEGKGVLNQQPLSGALMTSASVIGSMFKEVLFGLTDGPRRFYLLPVFGGWLGVMGLLSRGWRRDELTRVETWWMFAVFATAFLISISGWEGVQFDRYLTWILPVWFIYVAIGLRQAAGMFPWPLAFRFMAGVLLVYQGLGLVYFGSAFTGKTASLASHIAFAKSVSEHLPEGSRIGVINFAGVAYLLPGYAVSNVNGVVSPEFVNAESPRLNIEVLQHEPTSRFDAWLLFSGQKNGQWYSVFAGNEMASEIPLFGAGNHLALYEADWSSLNHAVLPLSPGARQYVYNLGLIDQVDIGYPPDEERVGYQTFTRIGGLKILPVSETLRLGDRWVTEAGRAIIGSESMRIRTEPGREVRGVLRTGAAAAVPLSTGLSPVQFASPVTLTLSVNGQEIDGVTLNLNESDQFTEAVFRIPAERITSESTELVIGGDHFSFAYWFYQ